MAKRKPQPKPRPKLQPQPQPQPKPSPPTPGPPSDMDSLYAALNRERRPLGLPDLLRNALLERAAAAHSADMAATGRLDHTGSDGSSFIDRYGRVGYQIAALGPGNETGGEIIAGGTSPMMTIEQVVQLWMNSPGHKQNILSGVFTEFGAGRSGNFWTVDFGRPA